MPRGVETPLEKVAEFRAAYLLSGNAYGAAREVGLPERTGAQIARALKADPEFAAERRSLRDTYLDELVEMRMSVARTALERFESGTVEANEYGDNVTVVDKRYEYGKLVHDAEKNALNLAKFEAGPTDEPPPAKVTVEIVQPNGSPRDCEV
jgi:hypothetical protein